MDNPSSSSVYRFQSGRLPILVSMPHVGMGLPEGMRDRLTGKAQMLPDTDWHIDRLYNFVSELGVSWIAANYSRYVIDLNRPPDDHSLYPGISTTELCPTTLFEGSPLYQTGQAPDQSEITQRIQNYWQPYHAQLQSELMRLKQTYGIAVLWDAHSIRSKIPRLFQGQLPDLNLGTFGGKSADPKLADQLLSVAQGADAYTAVLNGRFQGGYITRQYGYPSQNVHAVQLELTQRTYMEEAPPFRFLETEANAIRTVLRRLLETVIQWIDTSAT